MKRILPLIVLLLLPASLFAATNSVDLLWQGRGYVPPFYEGRTLWGRQTEITFYAVPHIIDSNGSEISPGTLTYRWSKDGTILGSASGIGENTISFQDSIIGLPIEVQVEIMADDGTIAASRDQSFVAVNPLLHIYEANPIYGYLFNYEAGQGIRLNSQEISFGAFPLFFSTLSRNTAKINYSWTTTGSAAQAGNSITYRVPEGQTGVTGVRASADAPNILAQNAEEDFLVQFSNDNAF